MKQGCFLPNDIPDIGGKISREHRKQKLIRSILEVLAMGQFVLIGLIAVILTFKSPSTYAQLPEVIPIYVTGEQLTRYCRSFLSMVRQENRAAGPQQAHDAGICRGLVEGILDAITLESLQTSKAIDALARVCLPRQLGSGAASEIVANYLEQHPEQRTQAGYVLVRRALSGSFPCPATAP